MNSADEARIAEEAIDILSLHLGMQAPAFRISTDRIADKRYDLILEMHFNQHQYQFVASIKRRLASNADILFINEEFSPNPNILIITEYIAPAVEEVLRQRSISYIDTRGNIFLVSNQLFVLINKADKKAVKLQSGSIFQKAGIKLLLYILQKPVILNLSYKQISEIAEISTGSISKILSGLKRQEFYYERNGRRIIRNRKALISQWVTAFGMRVRPELVIGRYRSQIEYRSMKLPDNVVWSGETAAELLNLNLKSQSAIIYTTNNPLSIIKTLQLIPDEDGNIELLRTFWNTDELISDVIDTAPSLIVYADLLLSASSRNMEIAEELYENSL